MQHPHNDAMPFAAVEHVCRSLVAAAGAHSVNASFTHSYNGTVDATRVNVMSAMAPCDKA